MTRLKTLKEQYQATRLGCILAKIEALRYVLRKELEQEDLATVDQKIEYIARLREIEKW